jgi:hypothetical protein
MTFDVKLPPTYVKYLTRKVNINFTIGQAMMTHGGTLDGDG